MAGRWTTWIGVTGLSVAVALGGGHAPRAAPQAATPGTGPCAAAPLVGTPASSAIANPAGAVGTDAELVAALRARGLRVEVVGSVMQPFLRAAAGTALRLSGCGLTPAVDLQVYRYLTAAQAAADAAQIGPDGNPHTAIVEWVAPPHFFRAGNLIVLYVGADRTVLALLGALLGPQFAGR